VKEAADGQEALELLEQYDFDLVITDLAMPKVTGFGLVAQMRVKWPDIPILILTLPLPRLIQSTLTGKRRIPPKAGRSQRINRPC
jgi:response regulator RpfG family c-di-GMP phosphodiesterase